jgi:hypothetical protein
MKTVPQGPNPKQYAENQVENLKKLHEPKFQLSKSNDGLEWSRCL